MLGLLKKNILSSLIFSCCSLFLNGQDIPLNYYLEENNFDPSIPSPEEFLGYQIGEWHISHDQLYAYLKELAQKSERIKITEYARSHEHRPLVYLSISNKENLEQLEFIKEQHQLLTDATRSTHVNIEALPGIIYQGYSIHGNESSGSNAAALVAYYLAAGNSEKVLRTLDNLVILLDPCYNPDGLQRFSTWVNSNRHINLVPDVNGREFNEPWPGGRTNHFLFDLNRDWLLLAHPESRGRIKNFHEWHPIILTDHHEMGSNSSFFFQPGVPSRTNPFTPQVNQDLTEEISFYHALALDSIGSEYFTKERFDDFYYGKGSTYPDVHGCVGILFEQASSRGHLRMAKDKLLSFPYTIRNQIVTSLSTQKAAIELKDHLLEYKRTFYRAVYDESLQFKDSAFHVWDSDQVKLDKMAEILRSHKIDIRPESLDGKNIGFFVPLHQKQHRLIRSLFEPAKEFQDSVFYDVSTWHFPSAFNVEYELIEYKNDSTVVDYESRISADHDLTSSPLYFDWNEYNSPALLDDLINLGFEVYRAELHPLISKIEFPEKHSKKQVIYIPKSNDFIQKLVDLANLWNVSLNSINLEETSMIILDNQNISKQKVAMITGEGISAYDVGYNWYQSDFRWNIDLTLLDKKQIKKSTLEAYDILIMPHGKYDDMIFDNENIESWIEEGGTLLAMKSAIDFLVEKKWVDLTSKPQLPEDEPAYKSPSQKIGGSIYIADVNQSHPLCFGYQQEQLALFKQGKVFYHSEANNDAVALQYSIDPVFSGYSSPEHRSMAQNAMCMATFYKGKGRIITIADSPNFRGFWYGGNKLYANILYFSQFLQDSEIAD